MNQQEIITEWVRRLRSGRYLQGVRALRRPGQVGDTYCCLGVLCEIAVEQGVVEKPEYNHTFGFYVYDDSGELLPTLVAEWAGIGRWGTLKSDPAGDHLTIMNDGGAGFDRIADAIEQVGLVDRTLLHFSLK